MREDEHAARKAAKRAAKLAANPDAAAKKQAKKQKRVDEKYGDDGAPGASGDATPADGGEPGWSVDAAANISDLVDEERWCTDCSEAFTYAVAEQSFFISKGWDAGKRRCTACTAAKKARFGEVGGAAGARAAQTTCYGCGKLGHSSRDCPQKAEMPCFNCSVVGHKSKDCPQPRKPESGVCHKFQTGGCTRGASCRFAHVMEAAA